MVWERAGRSSRSPAPSSMDEQVVLDHGCSAPSRSVYSSNSSSCGERAMYFCFLVLASSSLSSWLVGAVTMISRSICAGLLLYSRRGHNRETISRTLPYWRPLVISQRLIMEVEWISQTLPVCRHPSTKDLRSSPISCLASPLPSSFRLS